ncbi:MAG: DUF86 domain-containing protein [Caldilineaceae bacterium SB0665_bin_25]|nr:DUF86 domain-containing protein [Caldilineaceae bacterium SB0665_bin_25]
MELIGEGATHLPIEVREAHPEIPWRQIFAMRNKIAHAYLGLDVVGRDPFAVLAVVGAFAEDDDLVAQAAFVDPLTDCAFIVAVAVEVGSVEAVAPSRVEGVQHGEGVVEILRVYPHRSQHEAGDRLVDAGDVGIEHVGYS